MKATVRMVCKSGDTRGVTEFQVEDLHFWPINIGMRCGPKFFGEPLEIQVNWEDGSTYLWVPPRPDEGSLLARLKRLAFG